MTLRRDTMSNIDTQRFAALPFPSGLATRWSTTVRHAAAIAGGLRGAAMPHPSTASVVERIFGKSRSATCLFTDLRNPAANRSYVNMGFKPASCSKHNPKVPRRELARTRFAMDRFYDDIDSLLVRAYDAFYVSGAPIAGADCGVERAMFARNDPIDSLVARFDEIYDSF
jgi:hypothetical protein